MTSTPTAAIRRFVLPIVVLAAIGGSIAVGMSNISKANDLTSQSENVQDQNVQLQQKVDLGREASGRIADLTSERDTLTAAIPSSLDQEGFLAELSGIGARDGISIDGLTLADPVDMSTLSAQMTQALQTVSPDAAQKAQESTAALTEAAGNGLQAVPVSVTASGEYRNISAFISGAQHAGRIFWVNGADIQAQKSGDVPYRVILSGFIFVAPDGDAK
ncbi:hypothetical protein F8O07_06755 [Pseudoclavibacter sp. CFCC 13796]|uniref:hypothetical protein n=1 Tax=Pseudoclavibacter sp. CFCC 13796 TaxID=2615179 RepID=UPI0013018FEB|nr:hypothetical protein [Pseudoclavibacter sp. CFCC 13796]KAB1661599.1 hypothetical protein F8O07_06755 [Pseudoclavibacter sp. CFCC 13796]